MNLKENSSEVLIYILVLMATSDRQYHPKEKKLITKIAIEEGLSNSVIADVEKQATSSKNTFLQKCNKAIKLITREDLRKKMLDDLAKIAAIDAIIHEDEMILLQSIAENWEMFIPSLKLK